MYIKGNAVNRSNKLILAVAVALATQVAQAQALVDGESADQTQEPADGGSAIQALELADGSSATDTPKSANSRFAVTLGYAGNRLRGDELVPYTQDVGFPTLGEVDRERDDSNFSGGLTWFANDNFAVELWGAGKFDADVTLDVERGSDIGIARYQTQPISLSAQYHFTQLGDTFKPFVGLGYHRTSVSGVATNPQSSILEGLRIDDGSGLAATIGLDVAVGSRWFARGDVRYLRWSAKSYLGDQLLADADVNSLIYGVSMGLRF